MDTCLPDWSTQLEAELPLPCQKRSSGVDSELVELLWQNGEVVLQSQTHKKPSYEPNKFKQTCRDPNNNLIQENETVSWIQCPIDEAFEKEFCSKLMSEIPSTTPVQPNKLSGPFEGHNLFNFSASCNNPAVPASRQLDFGLNSLPPPRFSSFDLAYENRNTVGISEIVDPLKGKRIINRQCSAVKLGSSHCGSTQVTNDLDLSRASSCGIGGGNNYTWKDSTEREMLEQPITSSSGGSGSSSLWKIRNQSNDTSRHKRKSWNMEESDCKSDGTESESAAGNKSSQKSGTRRSRVAEVHNLSERKRRDRINEKMRALQELIPNSNKSDKASVLDEAIEYMKSLQLQLQFMWMGRGMAPMMLPGMQHYMARIGLGMGPPTLPQIQDLVRLSRFPQMINQPVMRPATPTTQIQGTVVGQTHVLSPVNYHNPMQNPCFPEQYANYMAHNSTPNTWQPPSNGNGYTG